MQPARRSTLTLRESEIAALAAAGLSCREIAEWLTVSVNTVKTHLRHVYEKCGVRSRIELAHRLSGHKQERET